LYPALAGAYAEPVPLGDLAGTAAETLSLLLIFASFFIIAYLTIKVRSPRSFQFEMFLFTIVLVAAEIPHILDSLAMINLGALEAWGLPIHSVSMVILSVFVAYRTYGFFRHGENALK